VRVLPFWQKVCSFCASVAAETLKEPSRLLAPELLQSRGRSDFIMTWFKKQSGHN